jgi:DNA-binding MarR family transcriptional regulator
MPTFDDDQVARLRSALLRIVRTIDRRVASDGMTSTQLSVLGRVRRDGPIGAGELAEAEGINPTMLSRVLSRLEESGLVRRTTTATDRRVVRIEITPQGRRRHDRLRAERSKVLAERLERLDTAQAEQLLQMLPALESLAEEMLLEVARA